MNEVSSFHLYQSKPTDESIEMVPPTPEGGDGRGRGEGVEERGKGEEGGVEMGERWGRREERGMEMGERGGRTVA